MNSLERVILISMLQRALAAQVRAETEAVAYARRLAQVVNASQRALAIAYLARINRGMVDPVALIDCLTEQDTPHEPYTVG